MSWDFKYRHYLIRIENLNFWKIELKWSKMLYQETIYMPITILLSIIKQYYRKTLIIHLATNKMRISHIHLLEPIGQFHKIIVDSLARISSCRHYRKYKDLLLNYLDEDGRRHLCYGTDGQAQKFEDTAMLNYRKIEGWELLIDGLNSFM